MLYRSPVLRGTVIPSLFDAPEYPELHEVDESSQEDKLITMEKKNCAELTNVAFKNEISETKEGLEIPFISIKEEPSEDDNTETCPEPFFIDIHDPKFSNELNVLNIDSIKLEKDTLDDNLIKCERLSNDNDFNSKQEKDLTEKVKVYEDTKNKEKLLKRQITCPVCFKVLKSELKRHLQVVHSREKKYSCKICFKCFADNSNLKNHLKIHSGIKDHVCPECGKRFYTNTHLKIHSVVHTGERNYKCDLCEKSFANKSHLNAHLKVHTGEKNHSCSICPKSFPDNSQLKKHFATHTGEKSYKCHLCPKAFSQNTSLKRHVMTHTGGEERKYLCNLCSKTFIRNCDLKRHLISHTGEKKFECHMCKKDFMTKSHVKIHMRIHTGEKQFVCNFCDKAFTQKTHLQIHLKRKHSDETNSDESDDEMFSRLASFE
ncbi:unnamed protein product [Psylliodes chrysocephalus]|uniref:C2H2-type domain-containing protein n=1 Tax=Psylliodes chrysocephalus TaxID=3402493 RepID=A0A9P0D2W1_9CUCU|nr:unnamed protein product [Psylliodes chrysocephala]